MSGLADQILGLHGWIALAVVFAVPALESSAFLGFLFPGEITVLLGGVLAYQHKVSLAGALAAAVGGAIIGDTIGFEVGKKWGRGILHGTVGRLVKPDHLERAERYLAERGGKAVFFGRFTAALRVLIPGMAGMAGMPYRTFAAYNVAGGTVWATGFVVVGYVAGNGYKRFERVAKQASLLLLLAVVFVAIAVFTARRVIAHRDAVQAFWHRQLERPAVARARQRFDRQLAFLGRRLRPGGALGLELTVAFVVLAIAGWAFGTVVADVVTRRQLGLDRPILDFVVRHRTGPLTRAVEAVSLLGSSAVLIPATALIGGSWWWRRHTWRPLALLGGCYAGSVILYSVVKALVARPRPPAALAVAHFAGWSFPSGHATQATAFWGATAVVVSGSTTSWPGRVTAWTAATVLVVAIGSSRVYLGAHWASDVLGGWIAGALWLAVVAVLVTAATTRKGRPVPDEAKPVPMS